MADTARAIDALHAISPDCDRDQWVRALMAAHSAGVPADAADAWSAQAPSYTPQAFRDTWRSIKPGKGIGDGTLYRMAAEHGWRMDGKQRTRQSPRKAAEPPRKLAQGVASPDQIWGRCEPATDAHGYIVAKAAAGLPLDGLRVLPDADPLRIAGQSMAGALVVPAYGPQGLQSLQLIPPPGAGKKLNLPDAPMAGASFTVGELLTGGVACIVEGIGTAWACHRATGAAAVVAFGWGNVARVAAELRQRDASARLVLVPDVGMEAKADTIARELGALVAKMPEGWERNSDVNDLAQREGFDVLEALLSNASKPTEPEPRFRLLTGADLAQLPPLSWRVRGVLPNAGLAAVFGPSASGKSFLALDMAAAIAEGRRWFDCRTDAAPVVYAALEGEAGLKLRAQAWEAHTGRALPVGLRLMLQTFKLTEAQDVKDFAAVVPAGAVVFVDTLNRAAPTADENSSRDMGEILEAAKMLQTLTGGLVVLVHHTGKDSTKGLRGHSSLFAALDTAVEVLRDGERREWRVAKSKDGQDGDAHPFRLQTEMLGVDAHGDAITSCVVVPDDSPQDLTRSRLPKGGNQKVVLDVLGELLRKSSTFGKAGAPPVRPCVELEPTVDAIAPRLTCERRRQKERVAGFAAVGRQQEFHVAELEHAGLGVFGLAHGFALLSESRKVKFAVSACTQVISTFDGVQAGEQEVHLLSAEVT